MAADLHCHTKYSDGSLTAEELVLLARRSGIDTIAVTDHDTFAGCERAASFGRKIGVRVLPGAEFSCVDPQTGRKAHVLCYQCSNPERLEPLCRKTCEARRKAGEAMLKKVMALYPISPQMVLRRAGCSTSLFKQHIMHALIDAGYAHEIFGPVFQKLFSRGGLASEPVPYPDVHAVLKEIKPAELLFWLIQENMTVTAFWSSLLRITKSTESRFGIQRTKRGTLKNLRQLRAPAIFS